MFKTLRKALFNSILPITLLILATAISWQNVWLAIIAVLVNIVLGASGLIRLTSRDARNDTKYQFLRFHLGRSQRDLKIYVAVDWLTFIWAAYIGFVGLAILLGIRAYFSTGLIGKSEE